ncbi:MAG TPA: efflux RND transporter periplasmic adaptor subunit [Thermoanaerobaculia bacterium]|nr:efflux RND transporter periplasmic adaptor subunit [Thermoanaerobaculia bacterium]
MNKKRSLTILALIVLIATGAFFVNRAASARETPAYRFATVERGDVQSTVSATGTLSAVRTVAVGTQVSGQISELFVDFNDEVKKGQLLARIDPTLQLQAVTDAQANLERAQAQALQARRDNNRNSELMNAGLVARSAYEQTDSASDVANANVKSARVALERARQNLSYTNIYAPIDGVVVERNVDSGQTVAASLSAPQLFLIANDLSNMQILANVGESDIASIKEGQKVNFTVQALPREKFTGVVKQVRLQSATQENVVNYTVVISVANEKQKLLPGMTARVEFLVDTADNTLKVANAALRFKPESATAAANSTTTAAPASSETRQARGTRTRGGSGSNGTRGGTLYVLDQKGQLAAIRVRTGITDGTMTVVSGTNVREGLKVVSGTMQASSDAASTSSNPFGGQQQRQQGGPRPGGF